MFTKTWDICVHGPHEKSWNFVSELGLEGDTSFRVQDDCEEPSLPSQPPRAQPFTGDDNNDDDNDSNDVMLHRGRVHRLPAPAPPRLCGQDRPEGGQGGHPGGHQGACHQHGGSVQAATAQWSGSGGQGGSGVIICRYLNRKWCNHKMAQRSKG